MQVATPRFEPAPQPPPAQKVILRATGLCDHEHYAKTLALKCFFSAFTLFELCGGVLS